MKRIVLPLILMLILSLAGSVCLAADSDYKHIRLLGFCEFWRDLG